MGRALPLPPRPPERYRERAVAARLLDTLYPHRLDFTQLPSRAEWAQAEGRRQRMLQDGLDAQIEELGGASFVDWLKRAHAAYGVTLGITQAQPDAPSSPGLRDQRDDLLDALRSYVFKVMAYADEDDAAVRALSERLLRPIVEWEQRHRASATAASSTEPAAPPAEAAVEARAEPAQAAAGDEPAPETPPAAPHRGHRSSH